MAAMNGSASVDITMWSVSIIFAFVQRSYSRLLILCLIYKTVFSEHLNFTACTFSEIVISELPSKAKM
jgi:hypothetical protein